MLSRQKVQHSESSENGSCGAGKMASKVFKSRRNFIPLFGANFSVLEMRVCGQEWLRVLPQDPRKGKWGILK